MLSATVQRLGDATVLHLKGRLVIGGGCSILRDSILDQPRVGLIVVDLAQLDRVDAWGLGVLLRLRELAHAEGTLFRLMNAVNQVERVLQLTRLSGVFEFCSVSDLFCLLFCAVAVPSRSAAGQARAAKGMG